MLTHRIETSSVTRGRPLAVLAAAVLSGLLVWSSARENGTPQLGTLIGAPYQVATRHRSDFQIRRDIRAHIDELGFARRQIRVFVINGRVTLHGRVESWEEAKQAQTAARSVAGVRIVVNNLNVYRRRH